MEQTSTESCLGYIAHYSDDLTSEPSPVGKDMFNHGQMCSTEPHEHMQNLNSVFDEKDANRLLEIMHAVFYFLEQPDGGLANRIFGAFYSLLIVVSVCGPIAATTDLSADTKAKVELLDTLFTVLFSIELAIKVACCPRRCHYLTSVYTMIDCLTVCAGYVPIIWAHSKSMWVALIATQVPILRLMKIARHSTGWRLLLHSMEQCLEPLLVPLYLMLLMVVFSGSLHFWIDGHFACGTGEDGSLETCEAGTTPAFGSIPEAMWFDLVTMTTVGYGDIVPHTNFGKVLAALQIVAGICYMAMPLSIIGNIFSQVWSDRYRLQLHDKLKESGATHMYLQEVFESLDDDKSGEVSFDEFVPFIHKLNLGLSDRTIRDVFNEIDVDKSRSINFDEFADYVMLDL